MLKRIRARILFLIIVAIPTFFATIYYTLIATDVYITEAKVIVKTLSSPSTSLGGISGILQSLGIPEPSTKGAYLIIDHIRSRDVMFELDKKYHLKDYYSSSKWDILQRFDPLRIDPSYENFFERYYKDNVIQAYLDTNSGVLTFQIRSADPDYGYGISKDILSISEKFINQLNKRASATALEHFKSQLEDTRNKVRDFSKKIITYMSQTQVVAPQEQIGLTLQQIAKLQEQLISKQLELSRIISIAPQNPKVQNLKREIEEIKKEIDSKMSTLSGKEGSVGAYSVEFELMKHELQLLQRELEANLGAYLQALNQLLLQQLFIERVEEPYKPDAPLEPREFISILTVFAISFAVWGILSLLVAGVKEHREE